MIIGVPKEIKDHETRVGLVPSGVTALREAGHEVLVETHAGEGSSLTDREYMQAGAAHRRKPPRRSGAKPTSSSKSKSRRPAEYRLLPARPDPVHLSAPGAAARTDRPAARRQGQRRRLRDHPRARRLAAAAHADERSGRTHVACRWARNTWRRPNGGRGILLGGVPGVAPANVVILGGGIVGTNAAKIALGMGAHVTIIDRNLNRLRELDDIFNGQVVTLASNAWTISENLKTADLVVGAVLIPGASAPRLVRREMIANMKRGAVVVDVAIDQGGCFETSHATTHTEPIYFVDGVLHYCVSNMPAAVPHTSTFALTNATFPYLLELANQDWKRACERHAALREGVNTYQRLCDASAAWRESQGAAVDGNSAVRWSSLKLRCRASTATSTAGAHAA